MNSSGGGSEVSTVVAGANNTCANNVHGSNAE